MSLGTVHNVNSMNSLCALRVGCLHRDIHKGISGPTHELYNDNFYMHSRSQRVSEIMHESKGSDVEKT